MTRRFGPPFQTTAVNRTISRFRLATTVVMISTAFTGILLLIVAALHLTYLIDDGNSIPMIEVVSCAPLLLLHLGTVLCLNEARTLHNLRLAYIGLILSLIPCANYSVLLIFPAFFTIWGLHLISKDEIKQAFPSPQKPQTPE